MVHLADPAVSVGPSRTRVRMCMQSALRAELGLDDHETQPELKVEDLPWVFRMGLQPLLGSQLGALDPSAEARAGLDKRRRLDATRNLRQASTSWSLQQQFLETGIQVLAYKGTALSLQTTQSLTGRAPGDVDLLIRLGDVGQVHSLLADLGWTPDPKKLPPVGRRGWWATQRIICETTYRGPEPSVDLHWRLDPTRRNYDASFDELWEQSRAVSGGGVELITLGETDSLLLTAVHGTRERWMFWRQIVDAARQLEAWSGSEEHLSRRATDIGAKKSLALATGMVDLAVGRPSAAQTSECEQQMARAWSHQAVGGDPSQAESPRGVREGQKWRWQTADTRSAAIVSFFSPALRRLVNFVA